MIPIINAFLGISSYKSLKFILFALYNKMKTINKIPVINSKIEEMK
jgi:hypothetical protein